jgi:hypothetical protein
MIYGMICANLPRREFDLTKSLLYNDIALDISQSPLL